MTHRQLFSVVRCFAVAAVVVVVLVARVAIVVVVVVAVVVVIVVVRGLVHAKLMLFVFPRARPLGVQQAMM